MTPKLRYSEAYRLAKATADAQCKKAGRDKWNEADFRCAVQTLSETWASPDPVDTPSCIVPAVSLD